MPLRMIRCRGKCKKRKSVACFRTSDVKSERPICRECRDGYRPAKSAVRRKPGWLWKQQQSNTLCEGSAKAMERFEAA